MERRGFFGSIAALFGSAAVAKEIEPAKQFKVGTLDTVQGVSLKTREVRKLRIWKLGSLEYKILPTEQAVEKLSKMLEDVTKTGGDLIWGPDLEVSELSLGDEDVNVVVPPSVHVVRQEDGKLKFTVDKDAETA